MDTIKLFKALSDATRLRCVVLLASHDELCVCELTHALGLPQPKVSHHLAALRKVGVVTDRKEGLWNYYRIRDGLPPWAHEVIRAAAEGVKSEAPFLHDASALGEMPNRPGGVCSA
ncbi:MAG: metalloregulator ArsR/SmtB family transcription factor [Gammaproteobacteria bacterium]|nr:metalloregulator ArsR/SmtB family transcription factor [Gammaproteobacteria bacterium]MCW8839689.1 metalloregulator ArsR/SmtB family transcription factor [Gammaproteobacteria bacterium]MCW8928173.1 metalloregulator ArsR/SmtB family transcription factor [Gammaproteobacteria bacterium]MCW8958305.1 metalloregulator ArsR/SmtB family transcription factor [Gammaproteobacteria bacterium]MCW8972445.1 metalloregulator ArsR/SmtB family transcription factor [Gammaproteobacteria bacterium]